MPSPHGASHVLSISQAGITTTTTILAAQPYDFWIKSFILEVAVAASSGHTVRMNGTVSDTNIVFAQADALKTIDHTFNTGFFLPAGDALELTLSSNGTYHITAEVMVKISQNSTT